MPTPDTSPSFGCLSCWPLDPQEAWTAIQALPCVTELADHSRGTLRILACEECGQHFLRTFVEEIDWESGDDPQFWTVVPITPAEHGPLVHRTTARVPLEGLAPDRWVLRYDYPKGAPQPLVRWARGFRLKPTDLT